MARSDQNKPTAMLLETGARLLDITEGCTIEVHEPDEQGLSAAILGGHFGNVGALSAIYASRYEDGELDNAFGDAPGHPSVEFRVELTRLREDDADSDPDEYRARTADVFNLATLIALARLGAESISV